MAEENNNPQAGAAGQEAAGPQVGLQKIYVKDASFEAPNAPGIFQQNGQTDVNLNLNQRVNQVADNTYEVVLTVTVTAKLGDTTAYLVEVQQAGIFAVNGLEQQQLSALIGSYCPQVLFPYARQAVSELVGQGGFPPLMLQHVDFNAVYAQQMQKRAQEQQGEGEQATASQASH
jgi:preprotein translocase subunit SecB